MPSFIICFDRFDTRTQKYGTTVHSWEIDSDTLAGALAEFDKLSQDNLLICDREHETVRILSIEKMPDRIANWLDNDCWEDYNKYCEEVRQRAIRAC